jgi:hypothetical protein
MVSSSYFYDDGKTKQSEAILEKYTAQLHERKSAQMLRR